jgi:hypothetical protein
MERAMTEVKFGPHGAEIFTNFKAWREAAIAKDLLLVWASNGCVAQNSHGTGYGFWVSTEKKGWLTKLNKSELPRG